MSQSFPPESENSRHDPYAAFRIADYRRYMIGWLSVLVTTQMQSTALLWEIWQRTDEPWVLGMVGLVQLVPALVLLLPAGHLADSHDRRHVIALGMVGATVTSLGLAAASFMAAPLAIIFLLLFLDSTFLTLARPARASMLPLIVPTRVFPNAVTWNSSLAQIGMVAGPALGGLVVWLYVPAAYLISAAGSMLFTVLILRLKLAPVTRKREPMSIDTLLGGARFIARSRLVLAAISLDMFAVLLGGATYLLPIYATDILEVDEFGFGMLRAAPAVGAFAMAITLSHLPPMKRAGRNLLVSVIGFGLATIVFGLSRSFWLSMAMLVITGMTDNMSVVIRHTLVQLATPDHMRGRVSAVNSVFINMSNEFGGFRAGSFAQFMGPVAAVVVGGVGTIAVVAVTALKAPSLRKLRRLEDVRPERVEV